MKAHKRMHLFAAILFACLPATIASSAEPAEDSATSPTSVDVSTNPAEGSATAPTEVSANPTNGAPASAATSEVSTNPAAISPILPPPLTVSVIKEKVNGLPQASRAFITAGANKFAFLMPAGFQMKTNSQETLLLVGPDQNCFITLNIVGPTPPDTTELDPRTYTTAHGCLTDIPARQFLRSFPLAPPTRAARRLICNGRSRAARSNARGWRSFLPPPGFWSSLCLPARPTSPNAKAASIRCW